MLVYVTAFYPLRPGVDYFEDFKKLMDSGVPILLFADPTTELPVLSENVERIPLELEVYRDVILPRYRNPEKDTEEFLSLMLMKLRCMKEALAYTDASHIAWIDFRIFHVIRDAELVKRRLIELTTAPFQRLTRIAAPGCWQPIPQYDIFNGICWRYCGGFLIGPRDAIAPAYARQCELVLTYMPRLTWEVNYWSHMDDHFEWYAADHDDSLILNAPYT